MTGKKMILNLMKTQNPKDQSLCSVWALTPKLYPSNNSEILQCQQKKRPTHLLTPFTTLQKLVKTQNQLNLINPCQKAHQSWLQGHRLTLRPWVLHSTTYYLPGDLIKPRRPQLNRNHSWRLFHRFLLRPLCLLLPQLLHFQLEQLTHR